MKNETKGKAIVNFEKIIAEVYSDGHTDGEKVGRKNEADEIEQSMEVEFEKRNTNYVVEKFADCKTLEQFQSILKEITLRSYNFL